MEVATRDAADVGTVMASVASAAAKRCAATGSRASLAMRLSVARSASAVSLSGAYIRASVAAPSGACGGNGCGLSATGGNGCGLSAIGPIGSGIGSGSGSWWSSISCAITFGSSLTTGSSRSTRSPGYSRRRGRICTVSSDTSPHTGTWFGSPAGGSSSHDRMARTRGSTGVVQNLRTGDSGTPTTRMYGWSAFPRQSLPSGTSNTRAAPEPASTQPEPKSTKNRTHSVDPRWHASPL